MSSAQHNLLSIVALLGLGYTFTFSEISKIFVWDLFGYGYLLNGFKLDLVDSVFLFSISYVVVDDNVDLLNVIMDLNI